MELTKEERQIILSYRQDSEIKQEMIKMLLDIPNHYYDLAFPDRAKEKQRNNFRLVK